VARRAGAAPIGRERDAELEVSLLTVREMRREHVELGGEPDGFEDLHGSLAHIVERSDRDQKLKERACLHRDPHVLEHGEVREDVVIWYDFAIPSRAVRAGAGR